MKPTLQSVHLSLRLASLFFVPLLLLACTPSKTTSGSAKASAVNLDLDQKPFFLFGQMATLAERDEQALVDAIAKQPELLTAADDDGGTALHQAAKFNRSEAVSALLRAGADANAVSRWGTPLEMAIDPAHGIDVSTLPVIQMLLDHGADPLKGEFGHSALLDAAGHEDPAVFVAVSAKAGDMTPKELGRLAEHCAREGYDEGLRLALARGLDVNTNLNAKTAIQWAAGKGSLTQMEMLLAAGADPTIEFYSSGTAMHRAIEGSKPIEALSFLLKNTDLGVNNSTKGAGSILCHAISRSRTNVVEFLLEKGADPDFKSTPNAHTAKFLAFSSGDSGMAELLHVEARPPFPSDGSRMRAPVGSSYKEMQGYTWPVLDGVPIDIVDTRTDCILDLASPGGLSVELKPDQLHIRQYRDEIYYATATFDPLYSLPDLADMVEAQVKALGGDVTGEDIAAALAEWRAATPETARISTKYLKVPAPDASLTYSVKMKRVLGQDTPKRWGLSITLAGD